MEKIISEISSSLGFWYYILVYAVGVIAIAFSITAFQMKRRFSIIILNCFGQISWVVHFLLQGDLTSAVACGLTALMLALFSQKERWGWVCGKAMICIFILVLSGSAIFSFKVWSDIFPILAGIFAVLASSRRDTKRIRQLSVLWCLFWAFNSIFKMYPIALVNDLACTASAITALYRYRKEKGE